MNNYKLYVHIAPNGKRYYGITSTKPKYRWNNGKGYKDNPYFTKAINKYGWNNIKHEVLLDGLTKHEAQELEQYMIQWYDTANRDYGYNLSLGGESGNHSEETKQKISKSIKDKMLSDEYKDKLRKAKLGKKHSEEHNQQISKAMKKGKDHPGANSVICLTTKRIFFTVKDAAAYYNVHHGNISKCCRGERKTTGKYGGQKLVWKYLNHRHNKTYRVKKGA